MDLGAVEYRESAVLSCERKKQIGAAADDGLGRPFLLASPAPIPSLCIRYNNKRICGGLKLCGKNQGRSAWIRILPNVIKAVALSRRTANRHADNHDSQDPVMPQQQPLSFGQVHRSLVGLFDGDMHAKRVESLANATLGVVRTGSLAVSTIGHGLALARGLTSKHAIKQVDRLLSNEGIDIDAALRHWVPYVVGPRTSINVAIDWTEFDADGQATVMLSLLTRHGRATPLLWLTVDTSTLKNRRNEYEYQGLVRLADALPTEMKVCIVADRGFGDHKLYQVPTEELKFDYVIRFRGNIHVTAADGEMRTAADWVGRGGRARVLRDALVTAERYQSLPSDLIRGSVACCACRTKR